MKAKMEKGVINGVKNSIVNEFSKKSWNEMS